MKVHIFDRVTKMSTLAVTNELIGQVKFFTSSASVARSRNTPTVHFLS